MKIIIKKKVSQFVRNDKIFNDIKLSFNKIYNIYGHIIMKFILLFVIVCVDQVNDVD